MDPIILVIAIGLAMDSFSVAVASSVSQSAFTNRYALKTAIFFGVFQGVMPVIGWVIGASILGLIAQQDHWMTFGLLVAMGGRMIYEAVDTEAPSALSIQKLSVLVMLSLATSIYALAVGLSYSVLNVPIVIPSILRARDKHTLVSRGACGPYCLNENLT
jgi:putative Mn2+ efflux pump MntP